MTGVVGANTKGKEPRARKSAGPASRKHAAADNRSRSVPGSFALPTGFLLTLLRFDYGSRLFDAQAAGKACQQV